MRAIILLLAAVLCCGSVQATVPQAITYQGYLTNPGGTPINTAVVMTFRLYNAASGGSALWTETHLSVNVANGIFDVVLGSVTPLTLPFDVPYWLTVAVNADGEMSPRQLLTSSPYALHSAIADALGPAASVAGAVPWMVASGPSQQALSNTGYIVTGATLATITLPPSPTVGDVVKVSSPYSGGFVLAPNAGQTIEGVNILTASTWIQHDRIRSWIAVASSGDGTKLVALDNGGLIYTSTDTGVTWTPRESPRSWHGVASSADGTKLVAVATGGQIYTSTDSGVSWFPRESVRSWSSVASSADGVKLVATVLGGQIYTSPDSGVTWYPRDTARAWMAVASSADGTKLVAVEYPTGQVIAQIYTSPDSGVTWNPTGATGTWYSAASSADGTKLVAVGSGQIYTSTDSGVTWYPRDSARSWRWVASSGDGTKLVAVVSGGQIYTSTDSGVTWTAHEIARLWTSAASSGDGTKLVAVVSGGQIYTPPTAPFSGGQYSSAELVYSGGGRWIVVNQQGALTSP